MENKTQHKDYIFSNYKFIRSNIEPYSSEDEHEHENDHDQGQEQGEDHDPYEQKDTHDFLYRNAQYTIKND